MTHNLTVTPRSGGKNEKLRKEGRIPAVVYGPKQEAVSISLVQGEFEKMLKKAGESSIITLAGLEEPIDVLIHEVEHDPVTGTPRHADFYAIEKGKKIQLKVPLEFVGEAPAVKLDAVITKVLHEVEIESLPQNLPQHLEIDLSSLAQIGDQLNIRDIKVPVGVEIMGDPDDVVAVVSEVKEEIEEVPQAIDMSAIEVEQKGKTEEEGEAAPEQKEE